MFIAKIDENKMRYLFCVPHDVKDVLLNMHCKTQNASCVWFVQTKHCASSSVLNLIQITYYALCTMLRLIKQNALIALNAHIVLNAL